jgi:hypothetical protein
VTEYRQKTQNHTAPITLEVEHLSQAEIEEHITELVWSYYQLYLPGVENDTPSKEYQQLQSKSERAQMTLEAAFGHRKEYSRDFLPKDEESVERVTRQIIGWTVDLDWPEGSRDGVWKSTAQTAEECCDKTAAFMKDKLWPFTKIIR